MRSWGRYIALPWRQRLIPKARLNDGLAGSGPLSVFLFLIGEQLKRPDRLGEERALVVARLGLAECGRFAAVEDLAFGCHPVAEAPFHEADAQVDRQHAAGHSVVPAHRPAHDEVEP